VTDGELVRYRNRIHDSARWAHLDLRRDDIIVSTPPKCGTTWTQMICVLLVLGKPTLDRPLSTISPWLDMETRAIGDVVADLDGQRYRRVIKTHTPRDGLPHRDGVTYICVGRDPRDVARSMDNHWSNMNVDAFTAAREAALGTLAEPAIASPPPRAPTARERFWSWVDDDTPPAETGSSLLRTLHHFATFWDYRDHASVVLLHYDDLQRDLDGSMRGLARRLGIPVEEGRWPELVAAATYESMRRNHDQTVPNAGRGLWHDEGRFFNRGTSGQWRELLDHDDDLARYRRRVVELADPALAAWAHGGAAGRSP
jgi:aryl sulfotransferase